MVFPSIMGTRLHSELGQDSFEPDEYVERLAWRATSAQNSTGVMGVSSTDEDFDAQALYDAFRKAIQELSSMQEKQRIKCQELDQVCDQFSPMYLDKIQTLSSLTYFLYNLTLLFEC